MTHYDRPMRSKSLARRIVSALFPRYERQQKRDRLPKRIITALRLRVEQKRWEMSSPTILYSDEYDGPRWRYGLLSRPPIYGGAPKDYIVFSLKEDTRCPYGTIEYPRQLTLDEVERYGMVDLGPVKPE